MTNEKKSYEYVCIRRKVGEKSIKFYGKTKKIAQNKYEAALEAYRNVTIELSNISFAKWANKWLYDFKYGTVRNVTFHKTYEDTVNNHLIPYFGDMRLASIKVSDIQVFINKNSTYSYSTLHKFLLCLRGIFECAVDEELTRSNPAKKIKLPKVASDSVNETRAYTYEQAQILFDFAKTHKYGIDIIMQLKAGLRRSELLALPITYSAKHGGIDMKNKLICVRQSLSESPAGLEIKSGKTKESVRNIPIAADLYEVLLANIKANPKRKYLISSKDGGYMYPSNWTRRHYAIFMNDLKSHLEQNKIKMPILRSHELRHTFGSVLYEKTKDIVTVSKLMGHSSIEITTKKYIHENMDTMRAAIAMWN